MKNLFFLFLLVSTAYVPMAWTQSVTLSNDGVYVARMSTSQRNAITAPTTGQLIYNTDDGCFNVYHQNGWQKLRGLPTINKGRWTKKADFVGTARKGAVSFSIGNKGYLGTGGTQVIQKDFWEYNPQDSSWTQKVDFGGVARDGAVGFSIGNKGYIGMGHGVGGYLKDFWEYDPQFNVWIEKEAFTNMARARAVGFSINDKGYVGMGMGGANADSYLDFWEYNPGAQGTTWTRKKDFPGFPRQNAVGFSIDTKGYIGAGLRVLENSDMYMNDFWEYDPSKDKWTRKASVGRAGVYSFGFSIGNKGYVGAGGILASQFASDFWEYDPETDTWLIKADIGGVPRGGAVGFAIGRKGYVGMGFSSSGHLKDFWEHDPVGVGFQLSPSSLPSTVTQQDNRFNEANRLLKLDSTAKLPVSTLPTTVTQLGNNFNAANQLLQLDGSAQLPVPTLPVAVTQQGNSFNAANQLLQLDGSAKLPVATLPATVLQLDGSAKLPRQLWVSSSAPHALNTYYYMFRTGVGPVTGNTTPGNYSIVADQRISAMEFNAYSDVRIKTVLGRSDAEKDLHLLQQLRITDYVYKDKLRYGSGAYKKVVAQEVEAVYPQAVSRKTEFVPDVYQKAKSRLLSASVMELALDTVVVWQAGQKLKLISTKGEEVIAEVTESGEGNRVQVKSSAASASEWFVYGRQVDDFRAVDYEALSMLHLSATQQLVRKMQQDRQRIDKLEKEIQAIEQLKKEAKRISQLEQDNQWMKEQLQLIKAHLLPSSSPQITAEAKP